MKRYLGQPPQTFLHGDFHLNNLLFDPPPGAKSLAVIDWQGCARGRATRDLAYFLVTSLSLEGRRAHERALLNLYCTALAEHGVGGHPFEQLLRDYRFTMLEMLWFLVMIGAHIDFSTETGRRILSTVIERVCGAILDHKAGELLPE
jgi:aminoglycoside/choline kinase family phosphotransferase